MQEQVTAKSTKPEILSAYNDLMKDYQTAKKSTRKEEQIVAKKIQTVEVAKQHQPNVIIKSLTELKLQMAKSLDEIGEKIVSEYEKLTTISQAIEIEKQTLATQHQINTNADTLDVLLLTQKKETRRIRNRNTTKKSSYRCKHGRETCQVAK